MFVDITSFIPNSRKYDKVDCFINAEKKWEVEIKVRADSAEGYSTLFLEVAKLKAMIDIIRNQEAEEGIYINFISNKAYIFNLRSIC